ncbi:MAG: response regulator transcription factor, partial [Rhodocyclaceae bacterium]|nr:response regulator transcription factor [Rhodocyclaceae bacterium]
MSRPAQSEQIIYVVDDDEAMRDSAAWLLESRGFSVRTLESAEAFLEIYGPALSGCLILDVRMPGMSGLELFEKLRHTAGRTPLLPVIFVTGHGDVPMAVGALKQGAADFIEKPFNDQELVRLVEQCLAREREMRARHHETLDDLRRLESLTERETEVMRLIVA